MKELRYVPSVDSEPCCALHACDNKCREEAFKFYQLVAIETAEGGQFVRSTCASSVTVQGGWNKVSDK